MPDYSEWQDFLRRQVPEAARAEHARVAQVITLRMEDLLASDEWGVFTAHVQALVEEVEATLSIATDGLAEAVGTDAERLRLQAAKARGMAQAYRTVLALPEQLRAQNLTVSG